MEVQDTKSYANIIYKMIVVNSDYTQDPEGLNRVQIYIPDLRPELANKCDEYLALSNKNESELFSQFPWAYTMFPNLKPGYIGFGSYVNNENNQFVILGLDANDPINAEAFAYAYGGSSSSSGLGGYDANDLVGLILPIMVNNEVGAPIEDFPNKLTDAHYGDILPDDNGGWSIGIIQWHNCLAFNIMHEIAKNDADWKSKFVDKSWVLVSHIESALRDGNRSAWANKWEGYVPVVGSSDYQSIKNMLLSEKGKETQLTFAADNIKTDYLDDIQADPYNVTNPAIAIFLSDIMNQYGPALPDTKRAAGNCSRANGSRMEQFDQFVTWCKSNIGTYSKYGSRRQKTIDYIKSLEAEGKFDALNGTVLAENLVDGGAALNMESKYLPEYGTYLWPQPATDQINCFYGKKAQQEAMVAKGTYHWGGLYQTRHEGGSGHLGIDIQGAEGDPVVATGSGTVVFSSDGYNGGAGNCVIIQMDNNNEHNFCYMHLSRRAVEVNTHVNPGQVVGYVGNTGASGGNHLHLGLHIGAPWGKSTDQSGRIDPLPYLGLKIKGSGVSLSSILGGAGSPAQMGDLANKIGSTIGTIATNVKNLTGLWRG